MGDTRTYNPLLALYNILNYEVLSALTLLYFEAPQTAYHRNNVYPQRRNNKQIEHR